MTQVLTLDQIKTRAPSVFATAPSESVSDKYRFVPTINVVTALMDSGFQPVHASQTSARSVSKMEHSRHILRFRQAEMLTELEVGEEIPEIVLLNSHDGTSCYQLGMGIFRLVCANGLVVASSSVDEARVRHKGPQEVIDDVIDASYRIIDEAPKVMQQITDWKQIQLNPLEQQAFAEASLELMDTSLDVRPESLLRPNRYSDRSQTSETDLWRTFNTVQENLVKGLYRGISSTGRSRRARAIKSIDKDNKLNKALWTLSERLGEAKTSDDLSLLTQAHV